MSIDRELTAEEEKYGTLWPVFKTFGMIALAPFACAIALFPAACFGLLRLLGVPKKPAMILGCIVGLTIVVWFGFHLSDVRMADDNCIGATGYSTQNC